MSRGSPKQPLKRLADHLKPLWAICCNQRKNDKSTKNGKKGQKRHFAHFLGLMRLQRRKRPSTNNIMSNVLPPNPLQSLPRKHKKLMLFLLSGKRRPQANLSTQKVVFCCAYFCEALKEWQRVWRFSMRFDARSARGSAGLWGKRWLRS